MLSGEVASAQSFCTTHKKMVEALGSKYGESLKASGITNRGQMIEVFASPTGSWTIVLSNAMRSCIVEAGQNWRQVDPPKKGEGT